jgi:lipopolysaccharide/colanic/teichoic acid biosynthesis glycosyltransferase
MNARRLRRSMLMADLAWAALALIIAYALRYGINGPAQPLWRPFSIFGVQFGLVAALWVVLHERMKLDSFRGGWNPAAITSRIFLGVFLLMVIVLSAAYLATDYLSRLVLFYFGSLLFVGFVGIRWLAHLFFKSRLATDARRRVVIVGAGRTARELAVKIKRHPEILWNVVGYLSPFDAHFDGSEGNEASTGLPVQTLGIPDLLRTYNVEEMIMVGATCSHSEMLNLATRCRSEGIQVSLVPELYELYLSRPNLVDLDGLPVLQLPQPTPLLTGGIKRGMDLVLALLLLIPATPIVLASAMLLRRHKAKVFCWDVRIGFQGAHFRMLRMNVDRHSPCLSKLERALVELSITELPQLINVLKGDMSLVGPRPEGLDRASRYTAWETQRLTVRPGITGLAQVHGLREEHSSEEKCRFDLQYLLDASPLQDISLLLQTVWTIAARAFNPSPSFSDSSISHPITVERSTTLFQEVASSAHRSQSATD